MQPIGNVIRRLHVRQFFGCRGKRFKRGIPLNCVADEQRFAVIIGVGNRGGNRARSFGLNRGSFRVDDGLRGNFRESTLALTELLKKIERRRRGNAHCGQQGDEGKRKADGTLSYGFRLFLCTSDQAPREIGVAVQAGERRIQRAAQTTVFPKFIHANASFPVLSEGLDGPAQGAPRR